MAAAIQRMVVQAKVRDKKAITARARRLDIPVSQFMRRTAFTYESSEAESALVRWRTPRRTPPSGPVGQLTARSLSLPPAANLSAPRKRRQPSHLRATRMMGVTEKPGAR